MFGEKLEHFSTSVIAWIEAPYFTSSSMTLMRFFLQAMCSGVKPFCAKDNRVSWKHAETILTQLHAGTAQAIMLARHITSPSLQTVLKWKFGKRSGSVCGGSWILLLSFWMQTVETDKSRGKYVGLLFIGEKKIEGKYALGGLRCFRLSGLVRWEKKMEGVEEYFKKWRSSFSGHKNCSSTFKKTNHMTAL